VTAGVVLLVLAFVMPLIGAALVVPNFVKPYRVPSENMNPTLRVGDRFLVWRLGGDPSVGDIVVFNPPAGSDSDVCGTTNRSYDPDQEGRACSRPTKDKADVNFVKRIVAAPGDTLAVEDGHVIRNGKRQREPFIARCDGGGGCNLPKAITVPPDHYFMMGDNRGASQDSRFWGPVPSDWIKGRAFTTYWPFSDIRGL